MPHFPMFVDLSGRRVLIVGGGAVALRKLQKLAPYGAKIEVVAPDILPEIAAVKGVRLRRREFCALDLRPRPAMVIAATDDQRLNGRISSLCRKRRIPVNVVDSQEDCSFIFPALISRGSFSAGICTGGASPVAAAYYKERLSELLPENLEEILDWLHQQRPALKKALFDQRSRAKIFRDMFEACVNKGAPLTKAEAESFFAPDEKPMGSVALVGAGCGKADMITVRGLRLLRQCQAVVYDDLIDPALLDSTPESAEQIYVGKRSGAHSAPQEEINQNLVELAQKGLRVVRLKGGDPYLFGRGGEEMLALKAAGIPCCEVPGIPSAIGIPAEAGIPVTHRGASRGLHIITAHTSDTADGLPEDFDVLAKLSGTLVFLMGLNQLPKIAARLIAAGKDKNTPSAVISGGNAPNPIKVCAPLGRLEQAVNEAHVTAPAVILVGEVAGLDLTYSAPDLKGVCVAVTGTEMIAEKQRRAFEALGAEVVWAARSKIIELPLDFQLKRLAEKPCWVALTSANGVDIFFKRLKEQNTAVSGLKCCKFAVIGAATGKALAKYGVDAVLCPEVFTGKALAGSLISAAAPDEDIYLFRSAAGAKDLPLMLESAGFSVHDISTYDICAADDEPVLLPNADYITFSSAGGVKLFFKQYRDVPENAKMVCIGEATAAALARHTDKAFLMADEISAQGIVDAVLSDAAERNNKRACCEM